MATTKNLTVKKSSSSKDEASLLSDVLNGIVDSTKEVSSKSVASLLVSQDTKSEQQGISLLQLKNDQMLSYCMNLVNLIQQMVDGSSIANSSAIDRLVECRTVLERIRPLEQKMQDQIDRLLALANNGGAVNQNAAVAAESKPGPRPDLMMASTGDAEEQSSDEDEAGNMAGTSETKSQSDRKPGVYVPPKITAVHYDEGQERSEAASERALQKQRRRAVNSSLMQELREQYSEAPVEIREASDTRRRKLLDEEQHRRHYEEDHMVRVQLTKKQQKAQRRLQSANTLDSLLDFGDYTGAKAKSAATRTRSKGRKGGRPKSGGNTPKRRKTGGRR